MDEADRPAYRRIWVAGHRGLVGSAVVRRLMRESVEILTVDRTVVDLRSQAAVRLWLEVNKPDAIIMAAAKVGGILANDTYPVDFLSQNIAIQSNIIDAAHHLNINRLVFLGSSCIYPKFASQPIKEESLMTGALEPTTEWYAVAKIAGIKLCQAYQKQYGRDYISLMPCNVHGPNDNFSILTSHVVPALIRRFYEAKSTKLREVTLWGTGSPFREFIHADDLADAIVFALYHYHDDIHLNCGSGIENSIRELAECIKDISGWNGEILFDSSKPDGTPRKLLDNSRLKRLGWSYKTDFRSSISRSYQWFSDNYPTLQRAG